MLLGNLVERTLTVIVPLFQLFHWFVIFPKQKGEVKQINKKD